MMTPQLLRNELLKPIANPQNAGDAHQPCFESYHLRAEYIESLRTFTRVTATHALVLRVGLQGMPEESSWTSFREGCANSHEAWLRYRKHIAVHKCKQ
jgi:hypothetical protein